MWVKLTNLEGKEELVNMDHVAHVVPGHEPRRLRISVGAEDGPTTEEERPFGQVQPTRIVFAKHGEPDLPVQQTLKQVMTKLRKAQDRRDKGKSREVEST